ncbi:MAG: hypothetical protein U9R01_05585, partial [candidate division WOR-3 bacterium]|nr:hypothetical protein [candidate division WOR-3 bacterium]
MRYLYLYWFPFLILYAFPTFAIDRGEIIDTAYQYYTIQWTPDEYNTGEAEDCWYHNYYQTYGDTVNSWPAHPYCDFTANISYIGEAYAYGWWDTHSDFKDWITYYVIGAGNHACHYWNYYYETGIASPDWTTGIDCSGFVSKCWKLNRHYSTSELANYGDSIDINQVDKGDIIVKPGRHVYLVDFNTGTGSWAYHAVGVDYIDGVGYISRPYRVSYDWIPFDAVPSSDGWCARSLWQTGVEEYYIQVNSPNGGEVWYYDETHNITWNTGTLA